MLKLAHAHFTERSYRSCALHLISKQKNKKKMVAVFE